jgi:ribulose-5-phosphate 4-epimerase/fuculose-1-phosphate aldolase
VQQPKLVEDPFIEQRIDMAAAFRWTARLNMHEGIANHFSLAVSDDGSKFLLNPYGRHFSKMRASDLLLVDAHDPAMGERDDIDPTAWCIHGAMHRNNPGARCIMHVHSKYVTALASLKDSSMPPIDQNTMRFYNRIAVDEGFDGMGMGDEAERLSTVMGNKRLAIMGNHGVMVVGNSVAEVFDEMYYFERACETLITALSTGRELRIASPEVAEKTAQQFENYPGFAKRHLDALKDILDSEEPDYRD